MNGDALPFAVQRDDALFIPLDDGRRIAATLWRPVDARRVPAIVEMLPYRRRDGTIFRDWPMQPYIAGHGFAYCRVDLAGTGDSDGLLTDEYTSGEQQAAVEIIAWLAAQDWCTGAIGMTGISWGGINALHVAALRPPALKAIITLCSTDDRYADDVHYMGGTLLTEDAMWSCFMLANNALPPDPEIVGERWRDMWHARLDAATCWSATWLAHQRRDEYWRRGSVCEDYGAIDIPVYAVGGWQDSYSNAIPRLLAGLKGPRKGLIGPWSHQFPCNGSPGPLIGYLQEAIRWWRQWLLGEDTGIMNEKMLRVWIGERSPPLPAIAEHAGYWVTEPAWPSPHIEKWRLTLNEHRLEETKAVGETMHIASPVTAGRDCGRWGGYGGDSPDLAIDQLREDGVSLVFDTGPLAADIELLGAPVLDLTATSDSDRVNLTARLTELTPDGSSILISWGVLNLSHVQPQSLVPGEEFTARLQLNDIGRRVTVGSRLRLAIGTAHWPIVWPQPRSGTLAIEPGACLLTLPVRQSRHQDTPPPFAPAERGPPLPIAEERAASSRRLVTEDVGTGLQRIELTTDYGRQRILPYAILTDAASTETMTITAGDPLSAQLDAEWRIAFQSGPADIEIKSFVTLTGDSESFLLDWRLEAREAGQPDWVKSGRHRIARDFL